MHASLLSFAVVVVVVVVAVVVAVNDFSNVPKWLSLPRNLSFLYSLLSPLQVIIVGIVGWSMEGDNLCVKGMRK